MTAPRFKTISPIDLHEVCETAYTTDHQLEALLNKASSWKQTPLQQRIAVINKFLAFFDADKEQIAHDICVQMGRPKHQALGEVNGVLERARYLITVAEQILSDKFVDGENFIRRYPLGKVLIIAPWNYPYLTTINSLIPALLAGNEVVLKHASQTPLCAKQLKKNFTEAGLPDATLSTVFLTHQQTEQLVKHPTIQFVNFTGSVKGGYAIEHAKASRLINSTLELGGKDAAIVLADCELEKSVQNLVDGTFFNSGQSCCGVERIYVAEEIYHDFIEAFSHRVKQYRLANPLLADTTLGPMVNNQAADFVRKQIKEALESGAKALIDESDFPLNQPGTAYLAPQVLINVDHLMSVMRDESFGPVVGIMPFKSESVALTLANDSIFGLTASVWSRNLQNALSVGDKLEAGTVYINRCDYLNPALPWCGVKESGKGLSLSHLSFCAFTQTKSFQVG